MTYELQVKNISNYGYGLCFKKLDKWETLCWND